MIRVLPLFVLLGCPSATDDTTPTDCVHDGVIIPLGEQWTDPECELVTCTCAESGLDCPDIDCDPDTDDTGDPVYDGPWEALAPVPDAGAWPATGVIGTTIHVIPSNATTHLVYDTAGADAWTNATAAPQAAHYHAGNVVDGRFYLLGGGSPAALDSLDRVDMWTPTAPDAWTPRAPMPTGRGYLTSAVVGGELFAIGGPNIGGETFQRRCEALDVEADTWRGCALHPDTAVWPLYSAIGTADDRVYLLGGGIANNPSDNALAYDVSDDVWVRLAKAPVRSHGPAGAVLDGKMYMIGGYLPTSFDSVVTDGVWVYDIAANTWSEGPKLPWPVAYSKAVAVGGCVFLVGGHDNANEAARSTFLRWCPA